MKKLLLISTLLILPLINGMFVPRVATTSAARTKAAMRARRPMPTIQKRTLYKPEHLKGLYSQLSEQARPVSPVIGAAKYESGVLQRMYSVDSDTPAIKLVKTLFYQRDVGGAIKPTTLKTNPAYSLTPGILGLVMGALEANVLQDPTTRTFIIDEWIAEHKNITNGDKTSKTKIENLLTIIEAEYANDQNSARSILMSFLYAKANPDNNHDMLHYLVGLSQYISVFAPGENIEPRTFTPQKSSSWMERFKAMANSLKDYFYTPTHYATARSTLKEITNPTKRIHYATNEGFEETISIIFKNKQESTLYPPTVIQASYGYQGKITRPNCVETAFQDITNILAYDATKQTFDLSLFPETIKANSAFIEFYSLQNTPSNVNSPVVGQAFMNLVSDVANARYSMDNYELKGGETYHNFIILMNHFFGLNVTNLDELSSALSDHRRTITFTHDSHEEKEKIIHLNINDHQNSTVLEADFCFRPGHGWLEVPQRMKQSQQYLLDTLGLAYNYPLSGQAQALFNIQSQSALLPTPMPASYYYTVNISDATNADNSVKKSTIKHILSTDIENKEATDYAYTLFQELPESLKEELFWPIMASDIRKFNSKFNNLYKTLQPQDEWNKRNIIMTLITFSKDNQEAVDYAYELFEQLPSSIKAENLVHVLTSGVTKINEKFKNIYTMLNPQTNYDKQQIFRSIIEYDFDNQEALDYAYELFGQLSEKAKIISYLDALYSRKIKNNEKFKNLYKTLQPQYEPEKMNLCSAIIRTMNNDSELLDFAYSLFEQLSERDKANIFTAYISNEALRTHEKFKNSYKLVNPEKEEDIKSVCFEIIKYYPDNQEALDHAYTLYQKMSPGDQYWGLQTILESGIWKTNAHFSDIAARSIIYTCQAAIWAGMFNLDTITTLYEKTNNSEKKERFLNLVLDAASGLKHTKVVRNEKEIKVSDEDIVTIAQKLLSLGCNVNASSKRDQTLNFTPLFFAIKADNIPLIDFLLENGALINAPATSKDFLSHHNKIETLTPLLFAIKESPKTIPTLLKHGANINEKTIIDEHTTITPLIMACWNYKENVIKLLLENGADPNIDGIIDGKITTPLLATVRTIEHGRNKTIKELIAHNVNLNVTDSEGNTALDIAIEQKIKHVWNTNNSFETVEILEKAGGKTSKKHDFTEFNKKRSQDE